MAWLQVKATKNRDTGKIEDYYRIAWREGGKKPSQPIGFVSRAEAERYLTIWEGKRAEARGKAPRPSAPSSTAKPVPTLSSWWGGGGEEQEPCRMRDYLAAQGLSRKTLDGYDESRRIIVEILGGKRLDEITPAEGDRFITTLQGRGRRSRTIQIRVDHLRRSLDVAVIDKILTVAPALTRPRVTDAKPHVWHTPEQTEQLLTELVRRRDHGHADPESVLAILMTVSLGMRRGEVLSRRWKDIDWREGGAVRIEEQPMPDGSTWRPKKDRPRTVPLTPPLRAALLEAWMAAGRGDGWIFPAEGEPSKPRGNFKKGLALACKQLGLPVLHPHALRHTAATRWAWAGVDQKTAMALGGWETGEMLTEIYAHTDASRMASVMATTSVGKPPEKPPEK
jgi:integrase